MRVSLLQGRLVGQVMKVATLALGAHLEQVAAEYLRDRYSGPGNLIGTQMLDEPPVLASTLRT